MASSRRSPGSGSSRRIRKRPSDIRREAGGSSGRPRSARAAAQAAAQKTQTRVQDGETRQAAEREAKRKAQAAAKARAEAEARARTQAEAKARAEQEERARKETQVRQQGGSNRQRRSSARQEQQAAPRRSARSAAAGDSGRSGRRARQSGRQSSHVSARSARVQTRASGGKLAPILIFLLLAGGLGAGGWYLTQGEDHQIKLYAWEKDYQKAHQQLQQALKDGELDNVDTYYERGGKAITAINDYQSEHAAEIKAPVSTDTWLAALDEEMAKIPALKAARSLRDQATAYRVRLNALHRIHDLDALEQEIKDFRENPSLDGQKLDAAAMAYFRKEVSFLNDAGSLIDTERQRRRSGFEKPAYEADNRNDIQKRRERAAFQQLKTNLPHKIEDNKFADAFKTALAFHERFPKCNIDEQWQQIASAEDAYWSKCKSAVERLISDGSPASKQKARSKLQVYLDLYANETYGDEARKLYARVQPDS